MDLIEQLDRHLLNRPKREQKWRWYATDLLKCGRQLFYKKTGVEASNPPEAGALWKMAAGDALHTMIIGFIRDAIDPNVVEEEPVTWSQSQGPVYDLPEEYVRDEELKKYSEWLVSGRIDAVFHQDGKKKGAEIKTSFGMGIKMVQQKGEPKDDHLSQAVFYLTLTDLEEIWLFYFGRDNGYRTVFRVYMEGEVAVYDQGYGPKRVPMHMQTIVALNRLRTLELQISNGEMPPRDFQVAIKHGEIKDQCVAGKVPYKSDWQCRYCDFKDLCWIDERMKYVEGDNRGDFHG